MLDFVMKKTVTGQLENHNAIKQNQCGLCDKFIRAKLVQGEPISIVYWISIKLMQYTA